MVCSSGIDLSLWVGLCVIVLLFGMVVDVVVVVVVMLGIYLQYRDIFYVGNSNTILTIVI